MEQPINENSTNQITTNNSINIEERKKNSGFGVASFVFGILSILSFFIVIVLSCVAYAHKMDHQFVSSDYGEKIAIGLFLIASLIAIILSFIFGIVGLLQKNSKKTFSIIGIVLSLTDSILILAILSLGFYAKHKLGM